MKKFVIIVVLCLVSHVFAQDTDPPVLGGFAFSPDSIDVLTVADTVEVTVSATDAGSGLSYCKVYFISPSGQQSQSRFFLFRTGSAADTATALIVFDSFIESGDWLIEKVVIADVQGNEITAFTADLIGLGFPASLNIVSEQDVEPPGLTDFVFAINIVNVETGPDTVQYTIKAEDNLSGLSHIMISLESPSGSMSVSGISGFSHVGSLLDSLTGSIIIPSNSEPGKWGVAELKLVDCVGEFITYTRNDLVEMDVDPSFTVISVEDSSPPNLLEYTFSQDSFIKEIDSDTLKITVSAVDDVSGLSNAIFRFTSPSEEHVAICNIDFDAGELSDTSAAFISSGQWSESGNWYLTSIWIKDVTGNEVEYSRADLEGRALPTLITVTEQTSGIEETGAPANFRLLQNYPNPFNPSTTIEYHLPGTMKIEISIYNILGEKVATLFKGMKNAGDHMVLLNAENLVSGIYFYELKTEGGRFLRQCLLLR
ncbi:T9SS type A sorting domain-containing protein [bacterium]|nr:T9SS type A sorting domain-containing protein [bacterium]